MGQVNNIPALEQIMTRRRPGDKPLSEPMLVSLFTDAYMCHSIMDANTFLPLVNDPQIHSGHSGGVEEWYIFFYFYQNPSKCVRFTLPCVSRKLYFPLYLSHESSATNLFNKHRFEYSHVPMKKIIL